jgi:hypothetical protein
VNPAGRLTARMIIAPVTTGLQLGSVKEVMKFIWLKTARNLVELVE